MIKIAKKPSYKIFISILFFSFLYVILPLYSVSRHSGSLLKLLYIAYFINIVIAFYFLRKATRDIRFLQLENQDLQEKINILNAENSKEMRNSVSLQEKIRRYNSLKEIIEEINQNLDLESIANNLATIAFSLIAKNQGVCVLYLVDNQNQMPRLFKTKKQDHRLIIKAKEGDIFDFWVLRHSTPLLIEDISKDFRFDLEKLKSQDVRPISSLISAPLISHNRFLGLLRLDHTDVGFYTQDDLRFLMTICELGAVALENGEFFDKTQELATHDELTSLFTKGYFLERLKEECKRSLRQGRALSLLMLDIDYFKNYNDEFGHTAGDIVLKALSQSILDSLKYLNPIVGRFGGEEFCIILSDVDKKKAYSIAEELRTKTEKTKVVLRRQETSITISIGLAALSDDARDEDELILKVDKALYEAKQKGRNRVCVA